MKYLFESLDRCNETMNIHTYKALHRNDINMYYSFSCSKYTWPYILTYLITIHTQHKTNTQLTTTQLDVEQQH